MTAQHAIDVLLIVAMVATLCGVLLAVLYRNAAYEVRLLRERDDYSAQEVARLRYYVAELERLCTPEQRQVAVSRAQVRAWQDDDEGDEVQP